MGFNSILNFFKLDDDEFDEYDDAAYEEEVYNEKPSEPVRRKAPVQIMKRNQSKKVVSLATNQRWYP